MNDWTEGGGRRRQAGESGINEEKLEVKVGVIRRLLRERPGLKGGRQQVVLWSQRGAGEGEGVGGVDTDEWSEGPTETQRPV